MGLIMILSKVVGFRWRSSYRWCSSYLPRILSLTVPLLDMVVRVTVGVTVVRWYGG